MPPTEKNERSGVIRGMIKRRMDQVRKSAPNVPVPELYPQGGFLDWNSGEPSATRVDVPKERKDKEKNDTPTGELLSALQPKLNGYVTEPVTAKHVFTDEDLVSRKSFIEVFVPHTLLVVGSLTQDDEVIKMVESILIDPTLGERSEEGLIKLATFSLNGSNGSTKTSRSKLHDLAIREISTNPDGMKDGPCETMIDTLGLRYDLTIGTIPDGFLDLGSRQVILSLTLSFSL